jgi:hypothetical protein
LGECLPQESCSEKGENRGSYFPFHFSHFASVSVWSAFVKCLLLKKVSIIPARYLASRTQSSSFTLAILGSGWENPSHLMKRWMGGLVLMGFAIVMSAGVAYSQGSRGASPSAQEALEKGKAAAANKNDEEAQKWYRIAAEQGNAEAQYELGNILLTDVLLDQIYNKWNDIKDGPEIASKTKEGFDWLLKSAEQGYAKAEYLLGHNYYQATTFTFMAQDKEKGLVWLRKAAAHGNEDAKRDLRLNNLSP